jgi:hypothetical protein
VPFWAAVSLAASTGAAPPTNKPATDRMVMILVLFIFVSPWYDFLLFLTDLRIIKKYGRSVFLKAHLCGIIGGDNIILPYFLSMISPGREYDGKAIDCG